MIQSMTGYGKGVAESETAKITVEIKSLNSKQLDLLTRVPAVLREKEMTMRQAIAAALTRGKVEATVTLDYLEEQTGVSININAVRAYKEQLMEMATDLQIAWPQDWYATLLRLPDALRQRVATLDDEQVRLLSEALKSALDAITEFRSTEGAKLDIFFREKISAISALLEQVEPFEQNRVPKIRARLEETLQNLDGVDYDKGRLEQEMIFYIEKLDITEEKTRLRSHLNYFLQTLGAEGAQGKKLGFIAQEMGREINTLGSKSNDADMQRLVVMMKDELEQIKEQVLNVL
ncbi:MAG: YicC family protein [Muribaculaceae bacterium]|nr:YicC family protein [Muribaculaceae bacterium]